MFNFKELAKKKNWEEQPILSKMKNSSPVSIKFYKTPTHHAIRFQIRFNHVILEQLGWDTNTQVIFLSDPDDRKNLKIVKATNGYQLRKITQECRILSVTVPWQFEIFFDDEKINVFTNMEFGIDKEILYVRIPF